MHAVKILLFSNLRVKAGIKELSLVMEEEISVGHLLELLASQYPGLKPHLTEKIVISINHKIADRTDIVPHDAEVALLPPVGGG